VLGPHDVVTSFDGTSISNDGTVAFRSGERISFSYLISQVRAAAASPVNTFLPLVHSGPVRGYQGGKCSVSPPLGG